MLPKPLRNPKIHPELLADDAHAKTAHKQPEAAPGDHVTAKAQKRAKRLRDPVKEPLLGGRLVQILAKIRNLHGRHD